MPIYEFRCVKCLKNFELLVMNTDDRNGLHCPHCDAEDFERVLSATNHAMGRSAGGVASGAHSESRKCAGGSCTTYHLPGPKA
jgi:putative FmdB family regulatory protein